MAIEKKNNYGFAIHPGTILADEIAARGMTHTELALRAGTSAKNISQIINGSAPISPEMAVKLEYVLGTPAHVWNNLMMNYQEALLRDKARETQEQEAAYAKRFDYQALRKICPGLPDVKSLNERVEALRRMFGVSSLTAVFDTDSSKYLSCAMRTNAGAMGKTPDKYALVSWLRVGELSASSIICSEYNARDLRKALPMIKQIINDNTIAEAWEAIRKLLQECGVKVVAVPYLAKTYVNGAVRWIGENPVIIISDRNAFADIFWFSLIHEICHILKHGKKYACLAFDDSVQCYDRPVEENEADEFAAEFFISDKEFDAFAAGYQKNDTKAIDQFAKNAMVPYYIVVGRLGHCKLLDWSDPIATGRPRVRISLQPA